MQFSGRRFVLRCPIRPLSQRSVSLELVLLAVVVLDLVRQLARTLVNALHHALRDAVVIGFREKSAVPGCVLVLRPNVVQCVSHRAIYVPARRRQATADSGRSTFRGDWRNVLDSFVYALSQLAVTLGDAVLNRCAERRAELFDDKPANAVGDCRFRGSVELRYLSVLTMARR
jgi:hypothetical protein